jgi:regulator of nucleoside diphosphate kinase
MKRKIFITEQDRARLEELIVQSIGTDARETAGLQALAQELERAKVVPATSIPADVVTMRSKVLLRDTDTEEEMIYSLTFPQEADIASGAISVLAPVGTALLGYATGDVIEWPVPSGVRRIRIEKILYQPEAAGDYSL